MIEKEQKENMNQTEQKNEEIELRKLGLKLIELQSGWNSVGHLRTTLVLVRPVTGLWFDDTVHGFHFKMQLRRGGGAVVTERR